MKYFFLPLILFTLLSCKEESNSTPATPAPPEASTTKTKKETPAANAVEKSNSVTGAMQPFLTDMKTFATTQKGNSIEKFQKLAATSADKKIKLSKENFADAIKTAANYKHIFITVRNHTVVKIDDVSNCKPSGSWATCVPYAYGYIKKGEMIYKENYANNIIGVPDDQERMMYLFH